MSFLPWRIDKPGATSLGDRREPLPMILLGEEITIRFPPEGVWPLLRARALRAFGEDRAMMIR